MISVGGNSYADGIRYTARKFSVRFKSDQDSVRILLRRNEREKTSKVLNRLNRIPLVRGVVSLIQDSKILVLVLLLDLMSIGITGNTESESAPSIIWRYIMLIIVLVILGICVWYVITRILKNLKSTWQYHGAEHKVIFVNYEKKEITLENCRNAPRISDDCETMFVTLFIFMYILITVLTSMFGISLWVSVHFIICEIIANELFLLDRKTPVICWFFKLGYWFQEHVCTSEPSDVQLNQAIEAFVLLEKAETDQIPEDKLQELLKKGKHESLLYKLF